MRIAILGSVALPVPPLKQGGTEWIAYHQAVGLALRGHKVLLLSARGSKESFQSQISKLKSQNDISNIKSNVEIIEVGGGDMLGEKAIKIDPSIMEGSRKLRLEMAYLGEAMYELQKRNDEFDIVLNNMRGEAVFYPLLSVLKKPIVTVLHLPLFSQLAPFFKLYNAPLISISNSQRKLWPNLNYIATVYNGVDPDLFPLSEKHDSYLLMMGTIGRHKNQKEAILTAKESGYKLVLAGKVRDQDYFDEISPLIDGEKIKWVGEMDFSEKLKLYQNAMAFIFPIVWEEPFGLVMIEAMSCGVPVVGYSNGAVPEVVEDGVTGFLIEQKVQSSKFKVQRCGIDGLVDGIKRINEIDRRKCRERVVENFTVEKMIDGYEKALEKLI